jgi:glutathione S-transferase
MKLYYSAGACSLSPHIVLREAGLEFELERVDTSSKKTATGADFYQINPKGYVPALKLDDGEVLTEGAAIVQYLADLKPDAALAPKNGTFARVRLQEQLNFIAMEIHKSFGPLFSSDTPEVTKQGAITKLGKRFDEIERTLNDGRKYLFGDSFTVADAYLFTVARWAKAVKVPLDRWPLLLGFIERVGTRPAVRAALEAEGVAGK